MSDIGFSSFLRQIGFVAATAFAGLLTTVQAAPSWTLLDSISGMVLASENDEAVVNPNDFVKLMTLYTALQLTEGEDDRLLKKISVSHQAAAVTGQQRIYLTANQQTEFGVLLRAIAVVGAEDACLAVADGLSGSREDFIKSMNRTAQKLGLAKSHFASPVPHAANRSTSRDLAILTQAIRHEYPEVFRWFSDKTFTYLGNAQRSRNVLLWRSNEVDGVMSSVTSPSFIASSTYRKNDSEVDRRLVAVYLSDKAGPLTDAAANAVLSLFVKGRTDYETIRLFDAGAPIARLEVLGGNRDRIEVGAAEDIWVSIGQKELSGRGTGGLSTTIEHLQPFWAPLKKGEKIATLHVDFEGRRLASFPLYALYDIGEGSFFSRFIDSVRLKIGAEPEKK